MSAFIDIRVSESLAQHYGNLCDALGFPVSQQDMLTTPQVSSLLTFIDGSGQMSTENTHIYYRSKFDLFQ